MTDREFWLRIQRKARRLEPDIAREILRSFERLREMLSPGEMQRLIEGASIERLLSTAFDDATMREAFESIRPQLQRTFAEAAAFSAKGVPAADAVFNVLNPRVLDAIEKLDTKVMTSLTTGTRDAVRQHVTAGLEAGTHPRTVARGIRDVVGLAPNHEAAVRNFRNQLEAGDLRALDRQLRRGQLRTPSGRLVARPKHAGGIGFNESSLGRLERRLKDGTLTQKQINAAVDRYRRRLQAWNAETHARTAALDSMKQGQRLSWEDAIEKGVVDRSRMRKRWSAVGDSRTRPAHMGLNGETVAFDEAFSNGEEIPGESTYNCRCQARYFQAAAVAA